MPSSELCHKGTSPKMKSNHMKDDGLVVPLSPWHTLKVNAVFARDLLITKHHDGVLQAIITLATSGTHCFFNGASAMVNLR